MNDGRWQEVNSSEPGESWLRWVAGAGDPARNMAWDEALFEAATQLEAPVLRLYGWTVPAATFGFGQRYADAEQLTALRPLLRRPTGGGVVPHDRDWTYALVFPPAHWWYRSRARDSYQRLHAWMREALDRIGLPTAFAPTPASGAPTHCFIRTEQSDLLWEGRKIAGAAQRRSKHGLLIQGSIQPPVWADRQDWERALFASATATWGVNWIPWEPDALLADRAAELARDRYTRNEYHQRR